MIRSKMTALKDYILQFNPYFNEGFSEVYLDHKTGFVTEDNKPVFPAEHLGNYFYLRLPNEVRFDYNAYNAVSECISGTGLNVPVTLVACVRDGDNDALITNLVNTLQAFNSNTIRLTSAIYQDEVVVEKELAKIGEKDIDAALQRIPLDYSIVSVSFTYSTPFKFSKPNCIQNPCATC